MRGQLKEILMGINEEINRENMDLGGIYRIDFLDDLVRICQCSILEQSSLYLAVEGKKEFIPSSLENEEPDEELRREKDGRKDPESDQCRENSELRKPLSGGKR